MKAFSPTGPAVKAFYGYSRDTFIGAKTIGNPTGFIPGAPAPPSGALNIFIPGDVFNRSFLSDFMTPQQQTDWQAGVYSVMNIAASGAPPLGYWILTSAQASASAALFIDLDPGIAATINLDSSKLRIYGCGGTGAGNAAPVGTDAGDAIFVGIGSLNTLDLNITNTVGGSTGRLFGGGGGGNFDIGIGQGGGGAGGYFPGYGAVPGSQVGGIYDPANGGASDPNVLGAAGAGTGKAGGGLGALGGAGTAAPDPLAGLAVNRNGQPGVTVVLAGGGANFIRGTVQ